MSERDDAELNEANANRQAKLAAEGDVWRRDYDPVCLHVPLLASLSALRQEYGQRVAAR